MMKRYQELLDYLQVVTKNQSEKVMTKLVDSVSGSPDMDFLERFYDTTLAALKSSQNERLWLNSGLTSTNSTASSGFCGSCTSRAPRKAGRMIRKKARSF
jgi:hypothetical protein